MVGVARRWSLVGVALLAAVLTACGAAPTAQPAPKLPALVLPAPLAGYHLFVSDLANGGVAELVISHRLRQSWTITAFRG
jgi:hypothetical protein